MALRSWAPNTVAAYMVHLRALATHRESEERYVSRLASENKSGSFLRQVVSAIRIVEDLGRLPPTPRAMLWRMVKGHERDRERRPFPPYRGGKHFKAMVEAVRLEGDVAVVGLALLSFLYGL